MIVRVELSTMSVQLYSVLDTVVISGDYVCCSVVFGTLVGVFVFSVVIRVAAPVRTDCGMFVMYCMQCCMSVSAVL